jgi:hypothetical protein
VTTFKITTMLGMFNINGKFEILYNNSQYNCNSNLQNITIKKSFIKQFKLEYDQGKCCICIEDFLNNNNILKSLVVVLKCNHVFHISCFNKYIKMIILAGQTNKQSLIRCPLCNDCNTDKLDFFYCYKQILENICSKKKQQTRRYTIVIKRIQRIKLKKYENRENYNYNYYKKLNK